MLDEVYMRCGFRQGGPLSGYLFIISVSCFLHTISGMHDVEKVCGFCDDGSVVARDLHCISAVHDCVRVFEVCSGQQVHRTKSVWIPSRQLTPEEENHVEKSWPGAKVITKLQFLGLPLGHGVSRQDFICEVFCKFEKGILEFRKA